jgi:hypothetical protein
VRSGFRARARCCARRCPSGYDVVNQHNPVTGDSGVGEKSILRIGEPFFFIKSMLGRPIVAIFQPGIYQNGL